MSRKIVKNLNFIKIDPTNNDSRPFSGRKHTPPYLVVIFKARNDQGAYPIKKFKPWCGHGALTNLI